MAVLYTPHFVQFFDDNGDPLSGGKLYTYAAGTTTPKATYTTAAGSVSNANPVVLDSYGRAVLFIDGSYRFDLYTSSDALVRSTDNVTSFTATGTAADAYQETFSGDGADTTFTTSESLGDDEKLIMVFAEREYTTNGTFASDTGWTKGTGWTIGSGVATATGAISTALEQTAGLSLVQGLAYEVRYTVTRSAGTVTPNVGGTAGTGRTASGTYSEIIIGGSSQTISFTTSGFTGTVDNVSVRKVGGLEIFAPNEYTISGTTLTFGSAPAIGTNNIQVWAPSRLSNAASAAAEAAATSAANALTSENNASTSETNAGTSETNAGTSETNAANSATSAQEWAIKTDGQVDATDYSAKAWAIGGTGTETNNAKYYAEQAGAAVSGAVKVSSNDTLAGDLEAKLVVGDGLSLSTLNDGSNESRKIDLDINGLDSKATPLTTDTLLLKDTADSNAPKEATVQSILDLASGGVPNGGYASSRYYFGIGYRYFSNSGNAAVTANRLYARPFVISPGETFTRIGVYVDVGSSGNARLGVYNSENGVPTDLVADLGTVDTSTSGEKEITISQNLPAGAYALAVIFSGTPEMYFAQQDNEMTTYLLGCSASQGATDTTGVYRAQTYGALPDPFGGSLTYMNSQALMPGIYFRKV